MAVKLRLMRMGKKKQPTYRVVAADSRSPRDGRDRSEQHSSKQRDAGHRRTASGSARPWSSVADSAGSRSALAVQRANLGRTAIPG